MLNIPQQIVNMFMQNPMAMLSWKYNIPQNMSNPQDIIQHLLNTNQISQEQVNNAKAMSNNPMFNQFFNK